MYNKEKLDKFAEGVRMQSEKYGLPTIPRKKNSRDERKLAVLERTLPVSEPK